VVSDAEVRQRWSLPSINCIAFALALDGSKVFRDTVIGDYRAWRMPPRDANTDFAEGLLDTLHWWRKKARPRTGDLVVYCDHNKRVKHMGLVIG
jgi:hypothetical protein